MARTAFQGVANIVRFNWHYYALAALVGIALLLVKAYLPPHYQWIVIAGEALVTWNTLISLVFSYYAYDVSGPYDLRWLYTLNINDRGIAANIHAGFDETSALIQEKYPGMQLRAFDFYDATKHTEVSIERARKAYAPYPGTVAVATTKWPYTVPTFDHIFLVLAAHEIRQDAERIAFFRSLKKSLRPGGNIIVVEHLRDVPNFIAYTIGFLHFHSRATWIRTFHEASLTLKKEEKINALITVFCLE